VLCVHAVPLKLSLRSLHRFAVKGMSPDQLGFVRLSAGECFPHE